MRTISQLIEEEIKKEPLIEEGLIRGIVNMSALAKGLKPRIEKVNLKKASIGAIVMALHRLSLRLNKTAINRKFPKISSFTIQSNLIEFLFNNSNRSFDLQKQVHRLINSRQKQDKFFNLSQGLFETTLIVSNNIAREVGKLIPSKDVNQKIDNLSAIVIRFAEPTAHLPGVYYPVLKALAWENINFIEVISVSNELTLIFEDLMIERAFQVIKDLIDSR
ncbi:MAG: aspartate kinase [Candidatus Doudnabacteria bacterium]|nr:aspartate kinase [Candidatus Doudnabacteria bacterium]